MKNNKFPKKLKNSWENTCDRVFLQTKGPVDLITQFISQFLNPKFRLKEKKKTEAAIL